MNYNCLSNKKILGTNDLKINKCIHSGQCFGID